MGPATHAIILAWGEDEHEVMTNLDRDRFKGQTPLVPLVQLNGTTILTVNENLQSAQFWIQLINAPTVSTQLPRDDAQAASQSQLEGGSEEGAHCIAFCFCLSTRNISASSLPNRSNATSFASAIAALSSSDDAGPMSVVSPSAVCVPYR